MIAATPSAPPAMIAKGWGFGRSLWSHRWLVAFALASVGVGAWFGVRTLMGPSVSVDRAARGSIVETVVASGNVLTPFRVNIATQIVGTVTAVQVDEGATVSEGQPLIRLDDRELRANLTQAKDAVAQAEARVAQLDKQTLPAAVEAQMQAKATLLNEQKTFNRTADLANRGVATLQALDDAQKNSRHRPRSAQGRRSRGLFRKSQWKRLYPGSVGFSSSESRVAHRDGAAGLRRNRSATRGRADDT